PASLGSPQAYLDQQSQQQTSPRGGGSTRRLAGAPSLYEYQPTPNTSTAVCRKCRKKVSDVASNYLFHLRDCDPEFLWQCLLHPEEVTRPPDSTDDTTDTAAAMLRMPSEEPHGGIKDSPISRAKLHSLLRFKENEAFLSNIFSTDTTVADILLSAGSYKFIS